MNDDCIVGSALRDSYILKTGNDRNMSIFPNQDLFNLEEVRILSSQKMFQSNVSNLDAFQRQDWKAHSDDVVLCSLCPPRSWSDAGVGIKMLRGISLLSAN